MKLFALLALGALAAVPTFAADSTTPAADADAGAASPTEAPATPSPVTVALDALIAKVNTKIQSGATTSEALAEDLKAFDDLLAAHKDDKSDAAAQVLVMKGLLYLQVLSDLESAIKTFERVKAEFPQSQQAGQMDNLLFAIKAQQESQKVQAELQPGKRFPDFAAKDIEGNPIAISQMAGNVVLVDFWATWCGPCVAELPNVVEAYKKYQPKGFRIVGISLDEDEARLKKFIQEKGMNWTHVFEGRGWESPLAKQYGITSIPATYLIDGEGRIVARDLRGRQLEAELAKLLGP